MGAVISRPIRTPPWATDRPPRRPSHPLEKDGHTVLHAANGDEAVGMWRHGNIDLILMDIQMPVLDGLGAAARIRAAELGTGAHVPIVALTAYAMPEGRARCLGMDDSVSKPFHLKMLREVMALGQR